MNCLQHFQSWPTYPCKLEEVISSACCAERIGQGSEHLVQQLAQQWTDCLSGMLVVDPALRKTASEVAKCTIWQQGPADAAVAMPHTSPSSSSAGSSRSGRSSSSLRRAESCGVENVKATAEKPRLSMRGKVSAVPAGKPLQNLQPSHQRRITHMIPLDGLATERAGDKDLTVTVRRSSAVENSGNDLVMTGRGGGVIGKAPKASRTKSTSGIITAAQQAHWPSGGGPMVRLSSSANHKSKSPSLVRGGLFGPKSLLLDSIG